MRIPTDPHSIQQNIFLFIKSKTIFTLAVITVIILNFVSFNQELAKMTAVRKEIPYIFMGFKFAGLEDILKNERYIGYVTDKDMDINQDALQFSQAQYMLAPTILDLNNSKYAYILFDFGNEEAAYQKMKEIGAVPMRQNQFGIILARNPNFQ